ncbi:cysteine desulfurase family protein [Microbacterium sp. UBA1097]
MTPYLTSRFGNPSSHHTIGEQAAGALADARKRVAAILGMRPTDVIFTSGATEANNLALKGVAIAAQQRRGARHVVTTPIEHESVLGSVDYLTRIHGFDATLVPVDTTGLVDPDAVAAAIRDDTAIVSVGYANNEIGTVQDVAGLVAAVAGRVPLHLDAVQAAGWLPLAGLGADALSIAGHKIGAPKGIGALGIRSRIPLEPVLHGGGQERDRRSGTENVAGAVGLARALELAEAERADAAERVSGMRDDLISGVLERVPNARLTGHPEHRLPGTASFTFSGVNGETVLLELERRGIVTSSGSACAAGSEEASHVLLALGIDHDEARTAVRVTLGQGATGSVAPVVDAIEAAVAAVGSGV